MKFVYFNYTQIEMSLKKNKVGNDGDKIKTAALFLIKIFTQKLDYSFKPVIYK